MTGPAPRLMVLGGKLVQSAGRESLVQFGLAEHAYLVTVDETGAKPTADLLLAFKQR